MTMSPQFSMGIPPKPPTFPDSFTSNPAGGSTVPSSAALILIPPHHPGRVPSTGHSVLASMPFPPVPLGIHGTSMSNGYPTSHSQMPPPVYNNTSVNLKLQGPEN